jgi:uncharacterized membrane protein YhaH (DUF805 family)
MDFRTSVRTCFEKYVSFEGRASRAEFWWFALFLLIAGIVLTAIDRMIFGGWAFYPDMMQYRMDGHGMWHGGMWRYGAWGYGVWMPGPRPLTFLFGLATLSPRLAVAVRRLHDVDRTGWWLLIGVIPVIGALVLLYWFIQPGRRSSNSYGVDPLV